MAGLFHLPIRHSLFVFIAFFMSLSISETAAINIKSNFVCNSTTFNVTSSSPTIEYFCCQGYHLENDFCIQNIPGDKVSNSEEFYVKIALIVLGCLIGLYFIYRFLNHLYMKYRKRARRHQFSGYSKKEDALLRRNSSSARYASYPQSEATTVFIENEVNHQQSESDAVDQTYENAEKPTSVNEEGEQTYKNDDDGEQLYENVVEGEQDYEINEKQFCGQIYENVEDNENEDEDQNSENERVQIYENLDKSSNENEDYEVNEKQFDGQTYENFENGKDQIYQNVEHHDQNNNKRKDDDYEINASDDENNVGREKSRDEIQEQLYSNVDDRHSIYEIPVVADESVVWLPPCNEENKTTGYAHFIVPIKAESYDDLVGLSNNKKTDIFGSHDSIYTDANVGLQKYECHDDNEIAI